MSSKTVREPVSSAAGRPWSLAARLTLWFFLSSFTLVFAATMFLYWALSASLDEEDDHFLTDRARGVMALLRERPTDVDAIRKQIAFASAFGQESAVHLRVVKDDGQVVAETPGMSEPIPAAAFTQVHADHGEALSGLNYRSASGHWFRVLAVRANIDPARGAPLIVQTAMDRTQEEELLHEYRRNLWLVLGASLLLCSVGGYVLIRRGIRPVAGMAAKASRIRSSTLDQRIELGGLPAELRSLAESFNDMLDRLEESFARLSQFSADIAHELRTPLSNLRGEAEVALNRPRSAEEYQQLIGSALEEYGRLARMIDSLLFLARAENPATHIACESLDVAAELERLREFYDAAAQEAGVRLTVSVTGRPTALLDRQLLQRALGNLIENALAHTPPQGTVTLTATQDIDSLQIVVIDSGHGIAAEHLPRLFDRFYRADQARRSTKIGSVGLGLAIVKSIVELHGGTVAIASEVGKGTQVRLRFPLAR